MARWIARKEKLTRGCAYTAGTEQGPKSWIMP